MQREVNDIGKYVLYDCALPNEESDVRQKELAPLLAKVTFPKLGVFIDHPGSEQAEKPKRALLMNQAVRPGLVILCRKVTNFARTYKKWETLRAELEKVGASILFTNNDCQKVWSIGSSTEAVMQMFRDAQTSDANATEQTKGGQGRKKGIADPEAAKQAYLLFISDKSISIKALLATTPWTSKPTLYENVRRYAATIGELEDPFSGLPLIKKLGEEDFNFFYKPKKKRRKKTNK